MSRSNSDSESFADDENSSVESDAEISTLRPAPILGLNHNSHSSDERHSIPVLTPQRSSPEPVNTLQQQNYPIQPIAQNTNNIAPVQIMEKLALCRKFGGYPHENGSVFLSEFESFAILHHIKPEGK